MTRIQKIVKLGIQIDKTRKQLADLESEMAELKLETLREVDMVKNNSSITLTFKGRKINARKNTHNRYVIKEGGKTLATDYPSGIHDLRFDLAMGNI